MRKVEAMWDCDRIRSAPTVSCGSWPAHGLAMAGSAADLFAHLELAPPLSIAARYAPAPQPVGLASHQRIVTAP
jgi:hypothetical protein